MTPDKKHWQLWFTDDPGQSKTRPVLLFHGNPGGSWTVIYVTSKMKTPTRSDWQIRYWQEAGLTLPSYVRCDKRPVISLSAFQDYIGLLHPYDLVEVKRRLRTP